MGTCAHPGLCDLIQSPRMAIWVALAEDREAVTQDSPGSPDPGSRVQKNTWHPEGVRQHGVAACATASRSWLSMPVHNPGCGHPGLSCAVRGAMGEEAGESWALEPGGSVPRPDPFSRNPSLELLHPERVYIAM